MSKKIESLRTSYLRCQQNGNLVEEFFKLFPESNPVIKLLFIDRNIEKQKRALEQGIEYILSFEKKYDKAMMAINSFHQKLSPSGKSMIMSIYLKYWKESFVKAVSNIDPKFDKELEENWNRVLQFVINYISNDNTLETKSKLIKQSV